MRMIVLLVITLLIGTSAADAQTNTPTPPPSPSSTPFPTWEWATLTQIPALSLTPRHLATPTAPVPGEPFDPSSFFSGSYLTSVPDEDNPNQITAINESAGLWLTFNIIMMSVALWIWFSTNYHNLLLTFRLVVILVIIIYAGSRTAKVIRQWEEKKRT